jgi:hypothetical protein
MLHFSPALSRAFLHSVCGVIPSESTMKRTERDLAAKAEIAFDFSKELAACIDNCGMCSFLCCMMLDKFVYLIAGKMNGKEFFNTLQILVYPIETDHHMFELRNDDPDGLNERSEPNSSSPQNSVHLLLSESEKELIATRNPLTGDEAVTYEINRLKNNSSQVVFVQYRTPEQAFTAVQRRQ